MPLSNPVTVIMPSNSSANSVETPVASAATDTVLLAENTNRKGAIIYNSSTARLYIALGIAATTSAFSVLLEAGGYYETPFNFTGSIHGVWAAANGSALVTELT